MLKRNVAIALILLSFVLLLPSCSKKEKEISSPKEEILSTHPDGSKRVTALIKREGSNKVKLKSFEFYPGGEKKKEYNHKDNLYFGEWTFWYKDGSKLAEGSFDEKTTDPQIGVGSGQYYWPNGTTMIRVVKDSQSSQSIVIAVHDETGKQHDAEKQPEELKERIRTILEKWNKGEV